MDKESVERVKTKPTPADFVEMTIAVFVMAFGVILTVRSLQGVSPVSSLVYVLSEMSGLTLGTMTFVVYFLFVLVQCAVYRDRGMTIIQMLTRSILTTNMAFPPPRMIPLLVGIW